MPPKNDDKRNFGIIFVIKKISFKKLKEIRSEVMFFFFNEAKM